MLVVAVHIPSGDSCVVVVVETLSLEEVLSPLFLVFDFLLGLALFEAFLEFFD